MSPERELGRRSLLRHFLPGEHQQPHAESANHRSSQLPLRRRPPGALANEQEFLSTCTGCDQCVTACPHAAVHKLTAAAGIGAGTPVMVPDSRACHMCAGYPCAAACEVGALSVPATKTWVLGKVVIDQATCLPFRGPECGACAGLCPDDLIGISMRLGRPSVESECIGCGKCIEACPVSPPAIQLLPLGQPESGESGESGAASSEGRRSGATS